MHKTDTYEIFVVAANFHISHSSILFFLERILVHTPSRRPNIDQMLESQWVNHPNLPLDIPAVPTSKSTKKSHWFARGRNMRRAGRDRHIEMSSMVPIQCNTKRASSIFADNFLCPIDMPNEEETIIPPPVEVIAKNHRKSLFSGTLKKKIGPMEENERGQMFNRTNTMEIKPMTMDGNDIKNGNVLVDHHKLTMGDAFEEELGSFLITPTCTHDLTHLHHLEIETRLILHKLGITSDNLCRAIDSGPRSDIIGVYRIVMHRLQRQLWLNKQAELIAKEELPVRQKNNRTCAIL